MDREGKKQRREKTLDTCSGFKKPKGKNRMVLTPTLLIPNNNQTPS
jgi:hypothetical protein